MAADYPYKVRISASDIQKSIVNSGLASAIIALGYTYFKKVDGSKGVIGDRSFQGTRIPGMTGVSNHSR